MPYHDTNIINDHFVKIATDPNYDWEAVVCATQQRMGKTTPSGYYSKGDVALMLARIRRTSPSIDDIPYLVYRDCYEELSSVVTKIVNLSFELGRVTSAWCTAVITPVPKCTPITGPEDLRPISVTPILSRMVERLVVKDHILPAISIDDLQDQYGFKPTGSTTAAIINFTHAVTVMLESNKYVPCLLVDFSKAFDSVDHLALVKKLKRYNIADNIIDWIVFIFN